MENVTWPKEFENYSENFREDQKFAATRYATACRAFLLLTRFWSTWKRLCMNRVGSSLNMRCMLLGYSFERALGTCWLTNHRAISTTSQE